MPSLQKMRVTWGGEIGLPGVSTFYSASLAHDTPLTAVKQLFEDLAVQCPDGIVWQVEESGVTIDEATGQPDGAWSVPEGGGEVDATGNANHAAPVGFCITWHTGTYVGGRELRGRTFFVPSSSGLFDDTGRLTTLGKSQIQEAADTYVAEGFADIYSPTSHGSASVQSASISSAPAVLRSRRD